MSDSRAIGAVTDRLPRHDENAHGADEGERRERRRDGRDRDEQERAIGYLCKYINKPIAATHDDGEASPAREAHINRLAEAVRWLPCAPTCAN